MITADPHAALDGASVALDFSVGGAVAVHARACARASVPLLVGATGLDAPAQAELKLAAQAIAVLIAPNTSLAVAVLNELAAAAARALGSAYDVDISEAHHRQKRDAPSGTALNLGETIARSRAVSFSDAAIFEHQGASAPRRPGSIGFSVVRAGDIVGEHTVTFSGSGGAAGNHAPGHGPDHFRPRGPAGRRLAGWAAPGALWHEGCAGTLRRSMDSDRGHR